MRRATKTYCEKKKREREKERILRAAFLGPVLVASMFHWFISTCSDHNAGSSSGRVKEKSGNDFHPGESKIKPKSFTIERLRFGNVFLCFE